MLEVRRQTNRSDWSIRLHTFYHSLFKTSQIIRLRKSTHLNIFSRRLFVTTYIIFFYIFRIYLEYFFQFFSQDSYRMEGNTHFKIYFPLIGRKKNGFYLICYIHIYSYHYIFVFFYSSIVK